MDSLREKVFKLTLKWQLQTELPLWAIANEDVIYAIAVGRDIKWGPRTRILFFIIKLSFKVGTSDFILLLTGMGRATLIWWTLWKKSFLTTKGNIKRIFVGFGAASEEFIFKDYIKENDCSVLRISYATREGMHRLGSPNLLKIFYSIFQNSFGYTSKLKKASDEMASNAINLLTVCALNIGIYYFSRFYWKLAKNHGVEEVAFLAPDIGAFACVDEGLRVIYIQHGLLGSSILIPKVNRIEVLTSDEESYLKSFLKDVQVVRIVKEIKTGIKNNTLMVLSPNLFIEKSSLWESLAHWAINAGMQVVLRPTPNISEDMLVALQKKFQDYCIDDFEVSLDSSFQKWKPKLVASWFSTGLAEALEYGYLPISCWDPDENGQAWNMMVYPMRDRTLFWPRDKGIIQGVICSEEFYSKNVKKLREFQDSTFNFLKKS